MRGRSDVFYQVDVYCEFLRTGITQQVAIECNDTGRPVEEGDLLEFQSKLFDAPNVVGVFVAGSGFQQGFLEYAGHYGIIYMTVDKLPEIARPIADRLAAVALVNEIAIGEPS